MWPWNKKFVGNQHEIREKLLKKEPTEEEAVAEEEVEAEIDMAEAMKKARETMDDGLDRLAKEFKELQEEVERIAEVGKDA